MIPAINNSIDSLSPTFRKKFDQRWTEVIAKYPNAVVFEARRSQERQDWLYAQGRTRPWKIVTRTKTSNHKDGNTVDIVFRNNGKLERAWPYNDLIEMAKKYGIRNLAPKELCHFEDDGKPLEIAPLPLVQEGIGSWDRPYQQATRYEVAVMIQRAIEYITKKSK